MAVTDNERHIDHDSTSFFIDKTRFLIRAVDKDDDFAEYTINDFQTDERFDIICSPSAWPAKKLVHYDSSIKDTHFIQVGLSEDDQAHELVGLALYEKNAIDHTLELGVIVRRDYSDTRLAHELVESLIRYIAKHRPNSTLTLHATKSEAARKLADQSHMIRLPSSETNGIPVYDLHIDESQQ